MVGFIVILPCITFFLVCLASLIQMGMVRSRMEYVAYAACRAAVVSTKEKAQEQAEKVARENTKAAGGAKISLVDVKVERVDPVTGKAVSSKKKRKQEKQCLRKRSGRSLPGKPAGRTPTGERACMSGARSPAT